MEQTNVEKVKEGVGRVLENSKRKFKTTALEILANLYSKGMLADPNLTSDQKILYGIVAGATGIDATLRIVTGYGIETYVKAGCEKLQQLVRPQTQLTK